MPVSRNRKKAHRKQCPGCRQIVQGLGQWVAHQGRCQKFNERLQAEALQDELVAAKLAQIQQEGGQGGTSGE